VAAIAPPITAGLRPPAAKAAAENPGVGVPRKFGLSKEG